MSFTTDEKAILKTLVKKELIEVKKKGKRILISNSPFLHKIFRDEPDLPFLKSEALYRRFLKELEKKL